MLSIYFGDLNRVMRNWAAMIIVIGLTILPSLYAWFNILASWNPYGQTGQLPIAVSSQDKGAIVQGKHINVGSQIVSALQNNHEIDWKFVPANQAVYGVKTGEYYASLIIPADFSTKLVTVLSHHPQSAMITYDVNDKINAVSPKITSTGASTVVNDINQQFVQIADGEIFQVLNQLGFQLQTAKPDIQNLVQLIFKLDNMTPQLEQAIFMANRDVTTAQSVVNTAQNSLPTVARIASDGADFSTSLLSFLTQAQQTAKTAAPAIRQSLLLMSQAMTSADQLISLMQSSPANSSLLQTAAKQTLAQMQTADDAANRLTSLLSQLNDLSNGKLSNIVRLQEALQSNIDTQTTLLKQISADTQLGQSMLSEWASQLQNLMQSGTDLVNQMLSQYDSVIVPGVQQAFSVAIADVQSAHRLFVQTEQMLPTIRQLLRDSSQGLTLTKQTLQTAQRDFPSAAAKVHSLAQNIRTLEQQGNLDQLIQLLTIPAGAESSFFAQPVQLQQHVVYPIPNYGSAISPFFTTLSLWVGALLLVSLLAVDVSTKQRIYRKTKNYNTYEVYFGRFFTFLTIANLQSLCVTLGDVYLLHTYVVDKAWFVFFGMLLSTLFMLMVYTLVSVFGNVGKASAIVLLVLQLAGAGGTFPIQLTPIFFQKVHPYLPFTYGISLMRESVGGALWDVVWQDLWRMSIFFVCTLIVGLVLKPYISRMRTHMAQKAHESRLIH